MAALRSMYMTAFDNDAAKVAMRQKGASRWSGDGIMDFKESKGVEFRAGRHSGSRHNTSSPDMVFDRFLTGGEGAWKAGWWGLADSGFQTGRRCKFGFVPIPVSTKPAASHS